MTKYEWETELKKNIHRLPPDEIKRVMEYYGELFDDYAERGKRETEIIHEFGNPVDVADKIMSEYDAENGGAQDVEPIVAPTPPKPSKSAERSAPAPEPVPVPTTTGIATEEEPARESKISVERDEPPAPTRQAAPSNADADNKSTARIALFVLLNIVTGGAFVIIAGVVWIVLGALVASGVGIALGGGYMSVISMGFAATTDAGSGLAQLGMGIALIGIGIALIFGSICLIKLCAKLTKKFFRALNDWLTAKKERV